MASKTYILRKPDLAATQIFVGDANGQAQAVTMSGDGTLSAAGVLTISAGAGVTLDPAQIAVGSSGSVATARTVSGDVTISNTGVTSITAGSIINADVKSDAAIVGSKLAANARTQLVKSATFNVDNGAGTTIDDCLFVPKTAVTITSAYVIPTTAAIATGGSAATIRVGTAVNGEQIVASVGLTEAAIGVEQSLTIVSGAVSAGTPVVARHTGVASTVAGEYFVQLEYTRDD